jgi:ribonuclease D
MGSFPEGATDVTTAEEAVAAVERLAPASELAVDLEADAMHAFRARLCFVQVSTDREVLLFDTLAPGVDVRSLGPAFSNPALRKVLHAAGGDLQYLAEAGIRVRGLFDTHRAATLLGWQKVGLADLARELVQVELPKEHQQSDFSIRPLPDAMRQYIADDVRYLLEIGRRVHEACAQADILEEVLLDCDRMCEEAQARPELAEFKPKLPRQELSREQVTLGLAIAKKLHALRLRWAEEADVPMGRMLSNAALSALAAKPPTTLKALSRTMGIRGAFVREHGDDVIRLIQELIELQRSGMLPAEKAEERGKPDGKAKKRDDALRAFRTAKAAERKVTPSVVLPNPLLEALAASPPTSVEALAQMPFFGEKRTRLYGAELVALLESLGAR